MVKNKIKNKKSAKISAFEDFLDLTTLVRIEKNNNLFGAYLLTKKHVGDNNNTIQLVFGFSCNGYHPLFTSDEQVENITSAFERGCREIPQGEKFTFKWSSRCNESEVLNNYQNRLDNPVSDECAFLDWAQVARMQELTRNQQRKNIKLNVYTTYTIKPGGTEGGDVIDKALLKLSDFIQRRFTPSGATELTKKNLMQILDKAANVAQRHQQILNEMQLSPKAKNEHEMWNDLCQCVNSKSTKVPHTLVYTDSGGLHEEFNGATIPPESMIIDNLHATSVLLNNGVPYADRQWVCLQANSNVKKPTYIGVMTLSQKPEAFASTRDQVKFLWNIFARENIHDVEIISEISPADQKLVRLTQQLITRRSRNAEIAASKKTIDVGAQINTEWSVDAQRQLYTGDTPVNTGLVVLVYRGSIGEVDDACRLISGYVNQPTEITRELQYAWSIWLDTLLLRQKPQLSNPYNRRSTFFSSEVIGVVPTVQIAKADNMGFELISDEGNSPIKIDLSTTKNMMILGTTGSGKSVLVSSIIAECLAQDMSILMIDLPNDDGSGTFGDFTPYFNGFYFDISRQSNNLMQPLDLSNIPPESREDRIKAHRGDVNLIVLQLILGSQNFEGFLSQTIKSVIPLGVKAFYDDPAIAERFRLAQEKGIGTPEWDNTPTLVDLKDFFTSEKIEVDKDDDKVDEAFNFIKLRLRYWENHSIGNAICKPSTYQSDSKLITFALTNLQADEEAEVFGMSAYIAASRQSLSSKNSLFFVDEASVLLKFPAISRLVGRKCATARKSGCRIAIAAQDVISIAKSEAGEQILQNMPLRLIGRIVSGAAKSFNDYLGIPLEIIERNESFVPNRQQLYTMWLIDYSNTYIRCRYYPSYPLLALVVNSREEQAKRDEFKAMYPESKFKYLSEFAKYYAHCFKQGKPL